MGTLPLFNMSPLSVASAPTPSTRRPSAAPMFMVLPGTVERAVEPPTATALMRDCPKLRSWSEVVRDDFVGDYQAAQKARNERYRAEREAFAAGWSASDVGVTLDANPHLHIDARRAWAWADGWESARRWKTLAGADINWLQEGKRVRIVRHNVFSGSLAGREGHIATVHRDGFLGWIIVRVPPQGRQKREREGWFRVGQGDVEPVDE
jgi:hypothetical protein